MRLQSIVTDEVQSEIDSRAEVARNGGLERSAVVQDALERYFYLLKRGRSSLQGVFCAAELSLLADSCNGTMFQAWSIPMLAAGIEDSVDLDHLDEKWDVDGAALISKLQALTIDQQFALVDAIENYWRSVSNSADGDAQPAHLLDF